MKNLVSFFIAVVIFSTAAISQNYSDYPFIKIKTMFSEQPVVVNKETDQMKKTDIGDKFIKVLTSDHQQPQQNINIGIILPANSNTTAPILIRQNALINQHQKMYLRDLEALSR